MGAEERKKKRENIGILRKRQGHEIQALNNNKNNEKLLTFHHDIHSSSFRYETLVVW